MRKRGLKEPFQPNSFTFNATQDNFHDKEKYMSDEGEKCVRKVLKEWKAAGLNQCSLPRYRNLDVAELLRR